MGEGLKGFGEGGDNYAEGVIYMLCVAGESPAGKRS